MFGVLRIQSLQAYSWLAHLCKAPSSTEGWKGRKYKFCLFMYGEPSMSNKLLPQNSVIIYPPLHYMFSLQKPKMGVWIGTLNLSKKLAAHILTLLISSLKLEQHVHRCPCPQWDICLQQQKVPVVHLSSWTQVIVASSEISQVSDAFSGVEGSLSSTSQKSFKLKEPLVDENLAPGHTSSLINICLLYSPHPSSKRECGVFFKSTIRKEVI